MKIFEDNKTFWKKIKPLFSEKCNSKRNIMIIENGMVTSNKKEFAEKFNNYFIDAVVNLEIEKFMSSHNVELSKNVDDNISNIINRYDTSQYFKNYCECEIRNKILNSVIPQKKNVY